MDTIEAFAGGNWIDIAIDEDDWEILEDVFVDSVAAQQRTATQHEMGHSEASSAEEL